MSCVIKTQVANGDADLNLVSLFLLAWGIACMMEFLTYLSVTTLVHVACVIELRSHFEYDMVVHTISFFSLKKD